MPYLSSLVLSYCAVLHRSTLLPSYIVCVMSVCSCSSNVYCPNATVSCQSGQCIPELNRAMAQRLGILPLQLALRIYNDLYNLMLKLTLSLRLHFLYVYISPTMQVMNFWLRHQLISLVEANLFLWYQCLTLNDQNRCAFLATHPSSLTAWPGHLNEASERRGPDRWGSSLDGPTWM